MKRLKSYTAKLKREIIDIAKTARLFESKKDTYEAFEKEFFDFSKIQWAKKIVALFGNFSFQTTSYKKRGFVELSD
ncbi:MAG: hypothetical protein LBV17_05420 [Treponema sp.]|jgi:hypothetical protein|nr:hypothetical protein [Treponema sp.]